MKKIKMLAILVIASVLFVPNVFANADPKLGTVTEYKPEDSVQQAEIPVIDSSNQNRITVTYSGMTELKVQAPDPDQKRYEEAAWFGFTVTAPTDFQADKAKLRRLKMDSDTSGVVGDYRVWTWNEAKDDDTYVNVYTSVTQEELEAAASTKGGVVSKTWEFDWDGDGTYEQVLEVILVPKEVTLLPKTGSTDEHTPLFTPAKYEEIQSNIVTVTFDFMGQQESMEVQKGSVLDKEGIAGLYAINLEEFGLEGYELDDYYADPEFTTKYDFTKPFESDVTIYMHAVKKEVVTPTVAEPSEENPDTSDINLYGLLGIFAIGSCGLAYAIRKRKFN